MKWIALALIAGCATPDPCAAETGACVTITVSSASIHTIDQLEFDLLWADRHETTTTHAASGTTDLPLVTAIVIDDPGTATLGVVAAGKLSGTMLGVGAGTVALASRAEITIVLAPPDACVAGTLYCGGDQVAGDPSTLYECNAGGVPLARGRCAAGCISRPAIQDTCAATSGACKETGLYCGGDKLDGDPQTLYRCTGGIGVVVMTCATGCAIHARQDDSCR